jgi:hypothetical protein
MGLWWKPRHGRFAPGRENPYPMYRRLVGGGEGILWHNYRCRIVQNLFTGEKQGNLTQGSPNHRRVSNRVPPEWTLQTLLLKLIALWGFCYYCNESGSPVVECWISWARNFVFHCFRLTFRDWIFSQRAYFDCTSCCCVALPNKIPYWSERFHCISYKGSGGKSLARPGRKQSTATEHFEFHISYLYIYQD